MEQTQPTTVKSPRTIIEMFTDATTGESYANNRMVTTETPRGTVALIAYGHHVLAEYDESEGQVTVYLGHKGVSKTVTGYVNRVVEIASERRDVTLSDQEPSVGRPADSVKFIGNYIGSGGPTSSVERHALNEVLSALEFADRFL